MGRFCAHERVRRVVLKNFGASERVRVAILKNFCARERVRVAVLKNFGLVELLACYPGKLCYHFRMKGVNKENISFCLNACKEFYRIMF